jgi:hypothetical protein
MNPVIMANVEAHRRGQVTAITGIRDLSSASEPDVWNAIADEIHSGVACMRFGGAEGTDTLALEAACHFRGQRRLSLDVYVPALLGDQSRKAVRVIRKCADEVYELDGEPDSKRSFLRRNDAMIEGADRLLAFTDGRDTGGTSYTIEQALENELEVVVVPVRSSGRRTNPQIDFNEFLAPVYALEEYVQRDIGSALTDFIWDLKDYQASASQITRYAEKLAEIIQTHKDLASCEAIIPMPRRDPTLRSDLAKLARAVVKLTKQDVLEGWLARTSEPTGGDYLAGREHFTRDEHAATLSVEGAEGPDGLIILDNVITRGGTMAGAQWAIFRDSGLKAYGLALAYSSDMKPFTRY